jgi:8-oxo-dGTP diphosphatase
LFYREKLYEAKNIKEGLELNATKNHGFQFLDFMLINEDEVQNYSPIAGSFAVIKCEGKILMVCNKRREQWELPAGKREGEETEKECAIRELYEETGQAVAELEFKGLLKLKNTTNGEIKYNPVFFSAIEQLQPFIENEETTEIKLWNTKEKIGYIDEMDLKILDYI